MFIYSRYKFVIEDTKVLLIYRVFAERCSTDSIAVSLCGLTAHHLPKKGDSRRD
jgi:hypothetical protein